MTKFTDTEQVILTASPATTARCPLAERSGSKVDPRAYGDSDCQPHPEEA